MKVDLSRNTTSGFKSVKSCQIVQRSNNITNPKGKIDLAYSSLSSDQTSLILVGIYPY